MIRPAAPDREIMQGKPRASGDDPPVLQLITHNEGRKPRASGDDPMDAVGRDPHLV